MPKQQNLNGLGGWLILVAIGIVCSPILLFYQVATIYVPLFNDLDNFGETFALVLIVEIIVTLGLFLFTIYLAYLFFSKNYKTPKLFIIFHIVYFFIVVTEVVTISRLFDLEIDSEDMKEIAKQIISCMIWIPYFLVSVRVKNTFVLGRKEAVVQDQHTSIVN